MVISKKFIDERRNLKKNKAMKSINNYYELIGFTLRRSSEPLNTLNMHNQKNVFITIIIREIKLQDRK